MHTCMDTYAAGQQAVQLRAEVAALHETLEKVPALQMLPCRQCAKADIVFPHPPPTHWPPSHIQVTGQVASVLLQAVPSPRASSPLLSSLADRTWGSFGAAGLAARQGSAFDSGERGGMGADESSGDSSGEVVGGHSPIAIVDLGVDNAPPTPHGHQVCDLLHCHATLP